MNRSLMAPMAVWLGACSMFLPARPDAEAGDRLVVMEDSVMQQVQGSTLQKLDHRVELHGNPGAVVPAGAVVRMVDRKEQRVQVTGAGTSHADHNPWIYVTVVESPVLPQVGWEGWIHYATVRHEGKAIRPTTAVSDHSLAHASHLCRSPDANMYQCATALSAGAPVRVVDCTGAHVHIEVWDAEGFYWIGYVKPSQFDGSPCGGVAGKD